MPADETTAVTATVLVYSDDPDVRERVRTALGKKPARDVTVEVVEAVAGEEAIRLCDAGGIDLAILDGEAAPTGGLGLCRQLKAELEEPPPILVLVGRHDDAWLATWSRADAVVAHPIDAMQLIEVVVEILRGGRRPLLAS